MLYRYAQIDADGRCFCVSRLSGAVEQSDMIALGDNDDVQPGDIFDGENWTRPEPEPSPEPEPTPDQLRIEELEAQNSEIILALVMNDLM